MMMNVGTHFEWRAIEIHCIVAAMRAIVLKECQLGLLLPTRTSASNQTSSSTVCAAVVQPLQWWRVLVVHVAGV
jgi:hypothetical protein